jgi:pimeloyl-ACP methyl ester carboxylesterase
VPFAHNGDVRLWYERIGDSADPAVLLLNGAGKQGTDSPDAFCGALAGRGFQVLRFDQRDTGRSTSFEAAGTDAVGVAAALASSQRPVLPYDVYNLADDAFAVLDAAGVTCAHLFGRSLGALVAQLMALSRPLRVRSLTLAMAFSRSIGGTTSPERLAQLDAEHFTDLEAFVARQVATAKALGNPAYFDAARVTAEASRAFVRGIHRGAIARHFMVGLAAPDIRPQLAGVQVPAQIIHGALDKVIPLAMAEETAAALPNARMTVLDDMAHEGPPQLWNRWIGLFAANAARAS